MPPRPRGLERRIASVVLVAIVVASWVFVWPGDWRAPRWTGAGWWPPNLDPEFLAAVGTGVLETLAISVAGTALALVLVAPLLFAATRTMMISGPMLWSAPGSRARRAARRVAYALARGCLVLYRSIPELVWAMLFIVLVGRGALPAVLALGVHTAGVFGKIFAELLEETGTGPQEAVAAVGAGGGQVFVYGAVGQVVPSMIAYVLYRWEVNIRMSALFGFVGAGALGELIDTRLAWRQFHSVTTLVVAVLVVVLAVDLASGWLRRRATSS